MITNSRADAAGVYLLDPEGSAELREERWIGAKLVAETPIGPTPWRDVSEAVLVLGMETPKLQPALLRQAFERTAEELVVINLVDDPMVPPLD